MIPFVCLKWRRPNGEKRFSAEHVNALAMMLRAQVGSSARLICLTDDRIGIDRNVEILKLPPEASELTRSWQWTKLYLFSDSWSETIGTRFFYLDLDVIVAGDLTPIYDIPGDLVISQGKKRYTQRKPGVWRAVESWFSSPAFVQRTPVNSSMMVIEPGRLTYLWDEFDVTTANQLKKERGYVGSDQAWIAGKAQNPTIVGPEKGVFRISDLSEGRTRLPNQAKLIFFPGDRNKPWLNEVHQRHPWIEGYYPSASIPKT